MYITLAKGGAMLQNTKHLSTADVRPLGVLVEASDRQTCTFKTTQSRVETKSLAVNAGVASCHLP